MKLVPADYQDVCAACAVALGDAKAEIAHEMQTGRTQGWAFVVENETLGHCITRQENETLVIVAYEGHSVDCFADFIYRVAQKYRVPFVRYHTRRLGLFRKLRRFEPEPLEYVIRVPIHGIAQP